MAAVVGVEVSEGLDKAPLLDFVHEVEVWDGDCAGAGVEGAGCMYTSGKVLDQLWMVLVKAVNEAVDVGEQLWRPLSVSLYRS